MYACIDLVVICQRPISLFKRLSACCCCWSSGDLCHDLKLFCFFFAPVFVSRRIWSKRILKRSIRGQGHKRLMAPLMSPRSDRRWKAREEVRDSATFYLAHVEGCSMWLPSTPPNEKLIPLSSCRTTDETGREGLRRGQLVCVWHLHQSSRRPNNLHPQCLPLPLHHRQHRFQ